MNKYVRIGAIFAMLAVAIGAFGAHMLKDQISAEDLDVYETGVQYHMFHAIGLLVIGLLMDKLPNRRLGEWAGKLLTVGIVLFSGSLYALATSGVKVLGAITPLGGIAFIAGWICVAVAAVSRK
ncbi:DUF423 domain-containing protein [Cohnella soli]|uniref:DUF423 domain-containing protein n=1 Tax=Cohnella soli TaxID=425005 RepID=A0ABW0HLV8_9BACL